MDGIDDEEEEADDDDKQDDEDTAESTAQPLQVDPLILQLVHYHHRVFNGSARYTAANAITALSAETQAAATKAAAAVAGRPSKPKAAKITGNMRSSDPKVRGPISRTMNGGWLRLRRKQSWRYDRRMAWPLSCCLAWLLCYPLPWTRRRGVRSLLSRAGPGSGCRTRDR